MKLGVAMGDRPRDTVLVVEEGSSVMTTSAMTFDEVVTGGSAALDDLRRIMEKAEEATEPVRLLPPTVRGGKLLFCGVNYRDHAIEVPGASLPSEPFFFAKLPNSVIADGDKIVLPRADLEADYEVEVAVVIGKSARNVAAADAHRHILGYTVVNDVSARAIQFTDAQITIGKGLDTFCPIGPAISHVGEESPDAFSLRSLVNGQVRQESTTEELVFGIPALIEYLSALITLEPGDIIATGTPAGTGAFRKPPEFLMPGDEVIVEVDEVGRLSNRVVAGWAACDGGEVDHG